MVVTDRYDIHGPRPAVPPHQCTGGLHSVRTLEEESLRVRAQPQESARAIFLCDLPGSCPDPGHRRIRLVVVVVVLPHGCS